MYSANNNFEISRVHNVEVNFSKLSEGEGVGDDKFIVISRVPNTLI